MVSCGLRQQELGPFTKTIRQELGPFTKTIRQELEAFMRHYRTLKDIII